MVIIVATLQLDHTNRSLVAEKPSRHQNLASVSADGCFFFLPNKIKNGGYMVDVIIDVQRGDCGKGKVSKRLLELNNYNAVAKYNGSGNAGHASWIGNQKYTTHYLTSAIYSATSHVLIGPGAIIHPKSFLDEYNEFDKIFNLSGRVWIHPFVNIITDEHIKADDPDGKIGSTGKGTGPCYADKYARKNTRTENVPELKEFLLTREKYINIEKIYPKILMEGSQGWWLDIDWGTYPYVTSSHIHPGFAFTTFGIPLSNVGTIYGVCKIYETYVGSKTDMVHANEKDANIIREVGKEYGETTGRPRKIGYLNLYNLVDAINLTGVQKLVVNKCDILNEVGIFKCFYDCDGSVMQVFDNIQDMIYNMKTFLYDHCKILKFAYFSFDKEGKDLKI